MPAFHFEFGKLILAKGPRRAFGALHVPKARALGTGARRRPRAKGRLRRPKGEGKGAFGALGWGGADFGDPGNPETLGKRWFTFLAARCGGLRAPNPGTGWLKPVMNPRSPQALEGVG